mmetsp:Transcript_139137/g.388158  ORF Transcript_139137/g.388158 Transcript_139137/m.388158 type:complete len:642 (-) Transcript_139137:86-2011(-)
MAATPLQSLILSFFVAQHLIPVARSIADIYDIDVSKWYGRAIYFLIVDRFAKPGVTEAPQCGTFNTTHHTGKDVSNWCGGTIKGLISRLDYIRGMGFDAIWITPVVKQVEWPNNYYGYGYDGYYAMDWYKIDPHFGTEQDVLDLGRELRQRNMLFMMDSVVNHAGPINTLPGWPLTPEQQLEKMPPPFNDPDGAAFNQLFRKPGESFVEYLRHPNPGEFPVYDNVTGKKLYDCHWPGDFYCGYNETVDMTAWRSFSDINQSNPEVQKYLLRWVKHYVNKYNLDGMRLDTVVDVPQWFIGEFQKAAGVFILGEVMVPANLSYHADFQNYTRGMTNMPVVYQWAKQISRDMSRNEGTIEPFENDVWDVWQVYDTSFARLQAVLDEQMRIYRDVHLLGNFVDSHDTNRFLFKHHQDQNMLINALTFVFMWHGIPIVYQGTEDPMVSGHSSERTSMWYANALSKPYSESQQLYQYIKTLNRLRQELGFGYMGKYAKALGRVVYADTKAMAFVRGDVLVAISNGKNDSSPYFCLNETQLPRALVEGCNGPGVTTIFGTIGNPQCRSYPHAQLCVAMRLATSAIMARAPSIEEREQPVQSLIALALGAAVFAFIPLGFFMAKNRRRKDYGASATEDLLGDSEESEST